MEEEAKIRGPPEGEISKSLFMRKREPEKAEQKPHNAVEAAIMAGAEHPSDAPKEQRVAIITGASSGIGKAVALHLASSNYNVVLVARRKEQLHEVALELAKYKVKTLVRECDVTKVVQVHDAVNHAVKTFGRIDILVNCAGYGVYGDIETMRLEDINGQMLTNYFGTVLFIKECLPKLKEHKGVIVNISSLAGLVGIPKMAAYSASKHAVVGLSESLRFELDGTGVSVSCVCPGKVKTNFFNNESFKGIPFAEDEDGVVPSAVARAVDKAIHERKFMYCVPAAKKFELFIGRLLPESMRRSMIKRNMKQE